MPAASGDRQRSAPCPTAGWWAPPPSAIPATRQHFRSNAAARCKCRRSALHRPSQCTALPIAPHCVFRPIAERDSVDPLSENQAAQSASRQMPPNAPRGTPFPSRPNARRSSGRRPKQACGLLCPHLSITVRHSSRSFIPTAPVNFLIQKSAFLIAPFCISYHIPVFFSGKSTAIHAVFQ